MLKAHPLGFCLLRHIYAAYRQSHHLPPLRRLKYTAAAPLERSQVACSHYAVWARRTLRRVSKGNAGSIMRLRTETRAVQQDLASVQIPAVWHVLYTHLV